MYVRAVCVRIAAGHSFGRMDDEARGGDEADGGEVGEGAGSAQIPRLTWINCGHYETEKVTDAPQHKAETCPHEEFD